MTDATDATDATDVIERTELLVPEPAYALGALLGVPVPDLARGDGLPPLWHWIYLLDRPAQADLGEDGHAVRGTLPAPPGPGRRRMWAGGRVRTAGPLRCGLSAMRRTWVLSMTEKQGRSGHLVFVTAGHQITQSGKLVIDEEQDIVYREAAVGAAAGAGAGAAAGARAAAGAGAAVAGATGVIEIAGAEEAGPVVGPVVPLSDGEWSIDVTPTLLFRFSALTYNAHRIHYDRDFCRDVEGYPGLVTHGPLQAIAMAEAARARGISGDVSFEYRLVSPLFDYQGLVVSATHGENGVVATAARDRYGRQTAVGSLTTRPLTTRPLTT